MKKIIDKIKKASLSVKIQLVIALLCTLAIPVYHAPLKQMTV